MQIVCAAACGLIHLTKMPDEFKAKKRMQTLYNRPRLRYML